MDFLRPRVMRLVIQPLGRRGYNRKGNSLVLVGFVQREHMMVGGSISV